LGDLEEVLEQSGVLVQKEDGCPAETSAAQPADFGCC